jgi:hypothetical protein
MLTHKPFKLTSLNNVFPAQLALYMSAIEQHLAIEVRIIVRVKRLLGLLCFGFDNVFPVLFRTSVVLLNFLLKLNFPDVSIGFLGGRRKFRPVLQRNWGGIPISPVTRPVLLMVHTPEGPSPKDPKLRNPIVMSSTEKGLSCKEHLNSLRA